jgi:predicted ArsR family transcriptional regulator
MYQKLNRKNVEQGRAIRAQILAALQGGGEFTREELVQAANVTYNQVRDHCRQLSMAGQIVSYLGERGERRYSLRQQGLPNHQAI